MNRFKHLLLFVLMIAALTGSSQNNFKYGVSAGLDLASIHSPKLNNIESKYAYTPMVSYNLNGFISYNLNSEWNIVAEPGYMRKGTSIKIFDDPPNVFPITSPPVIQHHIQIPISIGYSPIENLSINIGPEISYMVDDHQLSSIPMPTRKFELSGLVGIIQQISESWSLGLRYNHGITPINLFGFKPANSGYEGTLNEYNQYLQLMVRYTI